MSREQDKTVAEKIFGWKEIKKNIQYQYLGMRPEGQGFEIDIVPKYTAYPEDDYQVLKHIRENWDKEKKHSFSMELQKIWMERQGHFEAGWFSLYALTQTYEPGDYSISALKALGEI